MYDKITEIRNVWLILELNLNMLLTAIISEREKRENNQLYNLP